MPISPALWQLEKQEPYKHNSSEIQQSLGGGVNGNLGLEFLEKHHFQKIVTI